MCTESEFWQVRMPGGTLQVYLDRAKGLKDTEIIGMHFQILSERLKLSGEVYC